MPDVPLFNAIKEKIIPPTKEVDDEYFVAEDEEAQQKSRDVLQRFKINLETELPDAILVPSKLNKVRFTKSRPIGFHFDEVEAFHRDVVKTVSWLIDALQERDRNVHKLATEIDKYISDLQNANLQLQVFTLSAESGGEPLSEAAENPDVLALKKRVQDLEILLSEKDAQIASLTYNLEQASVEPVTMLPAEATPILSETESKPNQAESSQTDEIARLTSDLARATAEVEAYKEWEGQVTVAYSDLESRLADVEKLLADATSSASHQPTIDPEVQEKLVTAQNALNEQQKKLERLAGHIKEQDSYIDDLEKRLKSATEQQAQSILLPPEVTKEDLGY